MARWKAEKLASFSYHLKKMFENDISILDSLQILKSQKIIPEKAGESLVTSIKQGETFASAVRKVGVPMIFCAFVEAAEHHGDMCFALGQCHQYFQMRAKWLHKMKQVMFYPLFIFCFLCGGLLFLSTIVLPTFAKLYQSFSIDLPWTTQMVFAISDILPYFLLGLLGFGIGLSFARRTTLISKLINRLPIIKRYYRYRYTQYLSLQLGSFLTAGVPLLSALTLLERVTPWRPLCQYLTKMKQNLIAGDSLTSVSVETSTTLLPAFVQTVTLGEQTGQLGEMLEQLAISTEEWLTEQLEKWMTYLEPILTLVMGCIMAIVMISLFLPMFGLIQAVQ